MLLFLFSKPRRIDSVSECHYAVTRSPRNARRETENVQRFPYCLSSAADKLPISADALRNTGALTSALPDKVPSTVRFFISLQTVTELLPALFLTTVELNHPGAYWLPPDPPNRLITSAHSFKGESEKEITKELSGFWANSIPAMLLTVHFVVSCSETLTPSRLKDC